jgi:hypothetical protein
VTRPTTLPPPPPEGVEPTTKQRIATALSAAMYAKEVADRSARQLADVRTMVEANAMAIRETRENSAKAFKKLALSHDAIMASLARILEHVEKGAAT